jgi:nitrile hydratase accessory protein
MSESITALLAGVSSLPRDETGPVFRAPWEAKAFALAVHLHSVGVFAWAEWVETLALEIQRAGSDEPERYYQHWLAALERIVIAKNITTAWDLQDRRDAWDRAARSTPHGKPIQLGRGDLGAVLKDAEQQSEAEDEHQ